MLDRSNLVLDRLRIGQHDETTRLFITVCLYPFGTQEQLSGSFPLFPEASRRNSPLRSADIATCRLGTALHLPYPHPIAPASAAYYRYPARNASPQSASCTSRASRYWTCALFRLWSLLMKATPWVQKSLLFMWLSSRGSNTLPSPT